MIITALTILSVFILAEAAHVWAFSVDIKKLYYADNMDPSTLRRVVDYNFSSGTLTTETITIPDSFVTKPPIDADLSYIFGPDTDPTNDIAVALDTGAMKATLTSAVQGGCIISTGPSLSTTPAVPQWDYSVQLTNFSGNLRLNN